MDIENATRWATTRTHGILITIRADGRPQSSDIVYRYNDGVFSISVTSDRAKTTNMRRDPRVVLHVSDADQWSYVAFDGVAELSDVTTEPSDATNDALVEYYRAIAGEHDDWPSYRQAMIDEGRLLVTVRPKTAVGQINNR